MVTLGLMPPRAWHSGFRETVEDVDPSLHPSDLDGIDDEFDLFSQSPEDPSTSRTVQEEPKTAFSNSLTNGVWRCLMCDSTSSYAVGRDWKCADCGHGSFTEVTDRQSRSPMLEHGCSCLMLIHLLRLQAEDDDEDEDIHQVAIPQMVLKRERSQRSLQEIQRSTLMPHRIR